jgi:hypothetical protein
MKEERQIADLEKRVAYLESIIGRVAQVPVTPKPERDEPKEWR